MARMGGPPSPGNCHPAVPELLTAYTGMEQRAGTRTAVTAAQNLFSGGMTTPVQPGRPWKGCREK
jgi:hypothetical protein